jgi:hypothetical protein
MNSFRHTGVGATTATFANARSLSLICCNLELSTFYSEGFVKDGLRRPLHPARRPSTSFVAAPKV